MFKHKWMLWTFVLAVFFTSMTFTTENTAAQAPDSLTLDQINEEQLLLDRNRKNSVRRIGYGGAGRGEAAAVHHP